MQDAAKGKKEKINDLGRGGSLTTPTSLNQGLRFSAIRSGMSERKILTMEKRYFQVRGLPTVIWSERLKRAAAL
jgi:hypothetical protein